MTLRTQQHDVCRSILACVHKWCLVVFFQMRAAGLNHPLAPAANSTRVFLKVRYLQGDSAAPDFLLIQFGPGKKISAFGTDPFGPADKACGALEQRENRGIAGATGLRFRFLEFGFGKGRVEPVPVWLKLAFPGSYGGNDQIIPTVLSGYGPLQWQFAVIVHAVCPQNGPVLVRNIWRQAHRTATRGAREGEFRGSGKHAQHGHVFLLPADEHLCRVGLAHLTCANARRETVPIAYHCMEERSGRHFLHHGNVELTAADWTEARIETILQGQGSINFLDNIVEKFLAHGFPLGCKPIMAAAG